MLIIQFIPRLAEVQGGTDWSEPSIYLPLLAAIFGGILVLLGAFPIIGRIRRKCKARVLFEVTSKECTDISNKGYVVKASDISQVLSLNIIMKLNTKVQHISIMFGGEEHTRPIIQGLYDYQRPDNVVPNNVDVYRIESGKWFWSYLSPWPRLKGSKITIGIEYIARSPFKGELTVGVATPSDGDKAKDLFFEVAQEVFPDVAAERTL